MFRFVKPAVFLLCLAPAAALLVAALQNKLGPDPGETLLLETGEFALRFLIITLMMTPLRNWRGWAWPLRYRRMFGLFCFFYACLHLMLFLQFHLGWDSARVLEELLERPYITVGFAAWLLMLPLALTSTRGMQRRLRHNWRRLHRLVYPALMLGCLHLAWQSRSDIGEALVYSLVAAVLLGLRLPPVLRRRSAVAADGPDQA